MQFLNGRKFSAKEGHKDINLIHSVSLGRHRRRQQLRSENCLCLQPFRGCPADLGFGRSKDSGTWLLAAVLFRSFHSFAGSLLLGCCSYSLPVGGKLGPGKTARKGGLCESV